MIAGGNHSTVKSWQPERADFSARRRYASEQPPQAALSESQRGFIAQFTNNPSASRFVRHLPFQGRQGHFVPFGCSENHRRVPFNAVHPLSLATLSSSPRGGAKAAGTFNRVLAEIPRFLSRASPGGLGQYRIGTGCVASLESGTAAKNKHSVNYERGQLKSPEKEI